MWWQQLSTDARHQRVTTQITPWNKSPFIISGSFQSFCVYMVSRTYTTQKQNARTLNVRLCLQFKTHLWLSVTVKLWLSRLEQKVSICEWVECSHINIYKYINHMDTHKRTHTIRKPKHRSSVHGVRQMFQMSPSLPTHLHPSSFLTLSMLQQVPQLKRKSKQQNNK